MQWSIKCKNAAQISFQLHVMFIVKIPSIMMHN